MNELLALYLQAAAIGIAAAVSPGAFLTFLINQTLEGGWRRGAPVAFSIFLSDPPIVLTILLLLNQIPGAFIRWISLAGGLFVLYMAWSAFQALRRNTFSQINEESPSTLKVFFRGGLMNLLSPGPYTFWTLALGPLLLDALEQSPWHGAAFIAGFYSLFIGGMLGVVMVFHLARRLGPRVVRGMTAFSILILVIFGFLLLMRALGRS